MSDGIRYPTIEKKVNIVAALTMIRHVYVEVLGALVPGPKEHDLLLEGRKGIGEQGSKRRHEEGLGEVGNRRIDIGVDKENSLQGISLRDFKREVSEDGRKRGLADGDNAAFIRRAGAGGYTNGDYQGVYRDLHDEKRKAGYRQAFAAVSVNPDLALARSLVM